MNLDKFLSLKFLSGNEALKALSPVGITSITDIMEKGLWALALHCFFKTPCCAMLESLGEMHLSLEKKKEAPNKDEGCIEKD